MPIPCRLVDRQPSIIVMFVNHIRPVLGIINDVLQNLHIARVCCIVRAITASSLLFVGLVCPAWLPVLIRVLSSPLEGLEGSVNNVRWDFVVESTPDVKGRFIMFLNVVRVEAVVSRVPGWFKMDVDI